MVGTKGNDRHSDEGGWSVSFQSTGYSVLPRDEERLAALKRSKEETKKRVEAQRRRRAEMAAAQRGADEAEEDDEAGQG